MTEWTLVLGEHRLYVQGFRNERIHKMAKVLRVNGCIYAVNDKGTMFSSVVAGRKLIVHHNHQSIKILDAAAKFGLLPAAAVKKLKTAHDRRELISKRNWAAHNLLRDAKDMDILISPDTKRKITRALAAYKKDRG